MQKRSLRVWSVRAFWALTCLLVLAMLAITWTLRASMAQLDGTRRVPGLHGAVSVARDDYGVPLLQASNRDDLAYATGFVHAQ